MLEECTLCGLWIVGLRSAWVGLQGDRTAIISNPIMNFVVKGSSRTLLVFQIRQLHMAFMVYNYRPRTMVAARGIVDTFRHARRPRILSRRPVESLIGKKFE